MTGTGEADGAAVGAAARSCERVSPRAAIAVIGGSSLLLWLAVIALVRHLVF